MSEKKPSRKDQAVAVAAATAMCLGAGAIIEGIRAHMETQQQQEDQGQQR